MAIQVGMKICNCSINYKTDSARYKNTEDESEKFYSGKYQKKFYPRSPQNRRQFLKKKISLQLAF